MRLDKYLSSVTDLTRKQSKEVIKAGRVEVCGKKVLDPRTSVLAESQVSFDHCLVRQATPRYFMMNKPVDCVSATKDRQHVTAIDLMDEDNDKQLHIAGRLDIDTTGLLLITDDGQWSHRVTSPQRGCKKTYYIETYEKIDSDLIAVFKEGIKLDGEMRPTLPADLVILDECIAELTISEGKYHQVKRMFAAVGNKVDLLHRKRIGSIDLDDALNPGEYRALTTKEIVSI